MSGFTVMWACYCTDAADAADWLPSTCPEHDAPQVAAPNANPFPGGVRPGHSCHLRDINFTA